jgi:hypothetical protein
MNCLQCDNYWRSDIDEAKCEKCGCTPKESEEKKDE